MYKLCFITLLAGGMGARALSAQLIARPDTSWTLVRAEMFVNNPGLVSQRATVEAAGARAHAAGSAPVSELAADVEEGGGMIRLDVSRELWSGGRRAGERALAESRVDRARAELAVAERRLGIQADRLLLGSATQLAVARRVAAADSLLAVIEEAQRERFAVGEARYSEVLRLRAERLRVQSERIARLAAAERARITLRSFLSAAGLQDSLARLVDLAIANASERMPLLPDSIPASEFTAPSAVMLAEAGIASARAALSLSHAERRPVLAASLGVQRYDSGPGSSIGPTLGATLSLPFTTSGPGRAAAAAELDLRRAELARASAVAGNRATRAASLARYQSARSRAAVYASGALQAAGEEREVALAGYRAGEIALLELLDFEVALLRAEIERLELGDEAAEALADLLLGTNDTDHARDEEAGQ